MKTKPVRTCIGCRNQYNKDEMIRIVRGKERVQLDFSGKLNGRGAYICNNIECLEKAIKSNRIQAALKTDIDDDVIKHLKREIKHD